jgi:hypothetical protein
VASQDLPTTFDKLMHISKKKEIHMALTQLGLLFIFPPEEDLDVSASLIKRFLGERIK